MTKCNPPLHRPEQMPLEFQLNSDDRLILVLREASTFKNAYQSSVPRVPMECLEQIVKVYLGCRKP